MFTCFHNVHAVPAAVFQADVDLAVKAAKDAFAFGSPWRSMSAFKRALSINTFADLVQRNSLYIAVSVQHMF